MKNKIRSILYKNKVTYLICKKRIRIHEWFIYVFPYFIKKIRNPSSVFLILTPEHNNMGDHAIAMAEIDILNKLGIKYIEITGTKLFELQQQNFLSFMNGSTIMFNGGGNLGTLWISIEKITRQIIVENPKSKIIIFPNTIYYEDSEFGRKELQKSIDIYNRHSNLTIYAREIKSYEMMKKIYNNVKLVPDIVLTLDYTHYNFNRNGCLLCLRNDCEKTLRSDDEKQIYRTIFKLFGENIKKTDTCVDYMVSIKDRNSEVEKKLQEFSHAKLVITDRLHAMIFSAITGTPCIVVNSKSPKVKGCYEWIKNLSYIKFANNIDEIENLYKQIPNDYNVYNPSELIYKYKDLISDLEEIK